MTLSRTSPSRGPNSAQVTGFYDDDTGSIQYLVSDPETRNAALIDIVLTFDPESASTSSKSAEATQALAEHEGLDIEWILDTHPHADFPGGTAEDLYSSLQDILALPDDTRLFVGHDYRTA